MHEDFPAMLTKARRYLLARGKLDWSDSPTSLPGLRRSDSMGEGEHTRTRAGAEGVGEGLEW